MPDGDLGELLQQRAEPQLFEGHVPVRRQEAGQLAGEGVLIEVRRRRSGGQAEHRPGEEGGVFPPECQQQQQQRFPHPGVDFADHPEVEQVDRVVPPHQVPRMGVGVEEPSRQDLLVIGLDQLAGGLAARLAVGRLQQRYPLDLLQDQQPPGGQAGDSPPVPRAG